MGILAELPKSELKKIPFKEIVEIKGKIYEEYRDKEGHVYRTFVCYPIDVPISTYDIFDGEVVYFFVNSQGISVPIRPNILCPREILYMANMGFEVNYMNAYCFIKYLLNLISLSKSTKSFKKIGFLRYNDRMSFFWKDIQPSGLIKGMYVGDFNISSKGTVKSWRNGIVQFIQGNTGLELIICIAFAAELMGFIGTEKSIDTTVIHFWGSSSTGKSTGSMLAASVFGSPNISDNSLLSSWFATSNSIVESLTNLYGVLRILDDTSMAITKDIEAMIYKISNGKDKGRLTGDITKMKSGSWRTLVMTTGENPMLNDSAKLGAAARLIEFNLQLTNSAEHSHQIAEFVQQQYGTAAPYFAMALLKIGQETVLKNYDKFYKRIFAELDVKQLNSRLCKIYTLILLACKISNKVFKWNFDYNAIKDIILASNKNRKSKEDVYEDILDLILETLSLEQNKICFADRLHGKDVANKPKFEFIGKLDLRNQYSNVSELIINRKVIDDIIDRQVNYNKHERNKVYDYFRNQNYIYTYKVGYAKKNQIGKLRVPCICFNIKVLLGGRQMRKQKELPSSLATKIRDMVMGGE